MQKVQASVAGLDGNTGLPSFASAHEPGPNDGLGFTDTESQNKGGKSRRAPGPFSWLLKPFMWKNSVK